MQVNEKDVEDEWLMIDVEEEETKQSVKDSNDYNTNNSINSNNTSSLTSNGNVNFNRNGSTNNLHVLEKTMQKFQQLAKDAQSNGDPVLAQNYFQHADHYLRRFNELSQKRDISQDQSEKPNKDRASTTN